MSLHYPSLIIPLSLTPSYYPDLDRLPLLSLFYYSSLYRYCSGGSLGAVVTHWEQWWLIGSSGGSLVATPDCKTVVLGLNPAISPAYSGLLF
jgi:hypothetical protein